MDGTGEDSPALEVEEAEAEQGFVFAATGRKYTALARRAARNLRQVSPEAAIDLFTDRPPEDPVFDRIHRIRRPTRRPKMEALIRSRFRRTVYLDSDVIAVAPLPEVFDLLRHFDIAGVHEQFGNAPNTRNHADDIPLAFRHINGGVLGVRKSPQTDAFLRQWRRIFERDGLEFDQMLLRELLFRSPLRLAILPVEYNCMYMPYLANAHRYMGAPRLLHVTALHVGRAHMEPVDQPFDPAQVLGAPARAGLERLLQGDTSLGARPAVRHRASVQLRRLPLGRRVMRLLAGRLPWI